MAVQSGTRLAKRYDLPRGRTRARFRSLESYERDACVMAASLNARKGQVIAPGRYFRTPGDCTLVPGTEAVRAGRGLVHVQHLLQIRLRPAGRPIGGRRCRHFRNEFRNCQGGIAARPERGRRARERPQSRAAPVRGRPELRGGIPPRSLRAGPGEVATSRAAMVPGEDHQLRGVARHAPLFAAASSAAARARSSSACTYFAFLRRCFATRHLRTVLHRALIATCPSTCAPAVPGRSP